LNPAAELFGSTPRFLAVSWNFALHVGSALAAGNSVFFDRLGAKQRTARNETVFDEPVDVADAGNVGRSIAVSTARLRTEELRTRRVFTTPR
jgi:hypothetical protein